MKSKATNAETDYRLIEAVLELGDEQAFRALYRRHTPRLFGFVSRLLPQTHPEGEDIVQETWIRACERLGQFERRSAFSTWLLGIGLNVVRDTLRRDQRHRTVTENPPPDPPRRNEDSESRIDLKRAIQALPDDNRMVLVLHDVEGLTHQEIAERLEIPIGTTKSRLFRARQMIRERLTQNNGVKR
jgi:RNA polymerase sigma-70 factor (ECF subfamily)